MDKSAYQLYGFTPLRVNGKYVAACHICGKNLQNTASSELQYHRSVCESNEVELVIEVVEAPEENFEQRNMNPLELSRDCVRKEELNDQPERTSIHEEQLNTSNTYEINIEHCLSYSSNETSTSESSCPTRITNEERRQISLQKIQTSLRNKRNNVLTNLKNQKLKSHINYLRRMTTFYEEETQKLTYSRTSMILKSRKLDLQLKRLSS